VVQLPPEIVNGIWQAAQAAVVGFLDAYPAERRISRITITGPTGSLFVVYRGYVITGPGEVRTDYGQSNLYEAYAGRDWSNLTVPRGEPLTFAWSGGAAGVGSTGRAIIYSEGG